MRQAQWSCDRAIQIIRDDPKLEPAVATVLAALVKAAYKDLEKG